MTKALIRGDLLPQDLQEHAHRAYVHRFTREHVPAWSKHPMPDGKSYVVQFDNDKEWLGRTLFPVIVKRGQIERLAEIGHCRSFPTWPDGIPEGAGSYGPICAWEIRATGEYGFKLKDLLDMS